MGQVRITGAPDFPEGSVCRAYLKRLWAGPPPQPGDKPRAPLVTTSEPVDEHGEALLLELEDGETYYVGALVGSEWRWKTASTPPLTGSGGGGGGGVTTAAIDTLLRARGVIKSIVHDLGTASGSVTPDHALGDIFPVELTGDTTINKPINATVNAASDFCEVKIVTNGHKVFLGAGITAPETIFGLDGSVAKLRLMLVTDSDGTGYEALSLGALPEGVLRVASYGTNGQVLTSDGSKAAFATPAASGLSQAQVDARIKALSILTGEHLMTYDNAPEGAGYVAVSTGTAGATYVTVFNALLEHGGLPALKPHAVLTSTSTIVEDFFYPVNKSGSVQTLPNTAVLQQPGRMVAVRNEAGAAIKVKGKLNVAVPTEVTEPEVAVGDTILYLATGGGPEENVWIAVPLGRSRASIEALITALIAPGAWAAMSSLGTKIEQASGLRTAEARLEGANIRLRGAVKVKAAETLEAGQFLCTLPSGKRPETTEVAFSSGGASFTVATSGKVALVAGTIAAGTLVPLDHISFSLA